MDGLNRVSGDSHGVVYFCLFWRECKHNWGAVILELLGWICEVLIWTEQGTTASTNLKRSSAECTLPWVFPRGRLCYPCD